MMLLVNNNGLFGATVAGTDPRSTGGHPKLSTEKRRLQMNKFRFTLNVLAIAIFTFAFASIAQAQATRTWVSGVGDDANPCSRTAPCKTFAGAISKTAVDGEIDALDSGGFGSVTITKAITIDGDSNLAGVLAAGVTGIIVNITGASGSNTVEIRNLSINGAGSGTNGIRILSSFAGTSVFVEKCVIFGFRAGAGRGISDERTVSGSLFVQDTLVKNNSGSGIVAIGAGGGTVVLDNVQSEKNGSSGIVVSGGVVNGGRLMVARNCTTANNVGAGFVAENGAKLDIINSMTAYNATGIESDAANTEVRVSRTTVTRNTANGLVLGGGTILSYGSNEVSANAGAEAFTGGGPPLK
jgi:hypothetical protein